MPNLTVRKSSRPPKRKGSPTTRSEIASTPKPAGKRAKSTGFVNPETVKVVHDVDAADEDQDIQEVPKAVRDVSGEIFTLMKFCMLGTEAVVEDTDFIRLGEFSYRQFEILAVRKVDKAAQDAKVEFEWGSGQVVISSKGTRVADNISITVEDESGWRKVEHGVERWMLENRKSILVKLTIVYKRKGGTSTVISDDDGGDSKKVPTFQCC